MNNNIIIILNAINESIHVHHWLSIFFALSLSYALLQLFFIKG